MVTMKKRKAAGPVAGSTAGGLIGIITLVILFYILFLPPQDRRELLGDSPGNEDPGNLPTTDPNIINKMRGVVLSASPGSIGVPEEVNPKHLPNVFIAETRESQIIAEISPVYIKNGVFDTKQNTKQATFTLRDLENTDNIMMSFNVPKRKGMLTIFLNGQKIYEYVITKENPDPVKIDKSSLKEKNEIVFSVDGVGIQFWKTNEYALENIKITGEVTDISQQESRNIFVITQTELDNIDTATLRFVPYCGSTRQVGNLEVLINNKPVFSAVPVCDDPYFIPVSIGKLKEGENSIIFVTSSGRYSIEQITMDFKQKQTKSKIYYFEMDPELFLGFDVIVSDAECGKIDGICPQDCDNDVDKDCCYLDSQNNFWCDVETDDADDRCASAIDTQKCPRCPTGYEDEKGDPPESCEDLCGDDTDDNCPQGCDINFDKDCCFSHNEDNYWCEDVPVTGLSSVCETSLTSGECNDCPYDYRTESGSRVDCATGLEPYAVEEEDLLRPELNAILYVDFVDDGENKDVDLLINGHRTNIDQDRPYYTRDISDWVRPDNNYIELFPVTPLNMVKIEVRLE